jgi:hypothetical protein
MNKYRFINTESNIAVELYADTRDQAWEMLIEELGIVKSKQYSLQYSERKDETSFY